MDANILATVAKASKREQAAKRDLDAAIVQASLAGHSNREIAKACHLSHERVRQIVKAAKPDESVMAARLAELDQRWDKFVDALAERFAHPDPKGEQAYRNRTNHRIRLAQSGKTRAGKNSGACSPFARMRVMPTVRDEARRFAETFALGYLEENSAHPVCVKVLGELDEASCIREALTSIADSRVSFLQD